MKRQKSFIRLTLQNSNHKQQKQKQNIMENRIAYLIGTMMPTSVEAKNDSHTYFVSACMHNAVLDVVGCQAMKNSPEIAEANRLKSLERINKQKQA